MSAISNIYRTGSAVRNHMERSLLTDYDLSWVAFTVLWVLWIWGAQETGHVAAEAGITKGTLTGVMKTLQSRKLIKRIPHRALTVAEQHELARLLRLVLKQVSSENVDDDS